MDEVVKKPTNQNDQVVAGSSSVNKEKGPVSLAQRTEEEIRVSDELKRVGVESVVAEPQLTKEHHDVGIRETIPKPEVDSPVKVQLPIDSLTEAQARDIVKKGIGEEADVRRHFEGIYYAFSILGLAILKLKESSRKLLRQAA